MTLSELVDSLPRVPVLRSSVVVRNPDEGEELQTFVGALWESDDPSPVKCARCKHSIGTDSSLWCHGCGRTMHVACVKRPPTRRGPWHCSRCRTRFRHEGKRDVTLDEPLLHYLANGVLPASEVDCARIARAAEFLRLDESGGLWVISKQDGWERRVPPIIKRESYQRKIQDSLVHPSGDKMHQHLKQRVWWAGM